MIDRVRLSTPKTIGGNWIKVMRWMSKSFANAGFEIDTSAAPAMNVDDAIRQLASGTIDATVSLTCGAWEAAHSKGIYRGERLRVRGLALTVHPGHNFFNIIRRELGVRNLSELARVKPAIGFCVPPRESIVGVIVRAYMRHYGVDIDEDIPAWGGSVFTAFMEVPRLFVDSRAGVLLRENTRINPAGIVADLCDMTCLSLDREIAQQIADEYGTPVVVMPPGTLRGQVDPVVTISNSGYPILVNEDVPDELVYRMARALNEASDNHALAEDIFYSVRHAPETGAPLHPGAARYYRDKGVLA